jgi:hypothetical protein
MCVWGEEKSVRRNNGKRVNKRGKNNINKELCLYCDADGNHPSIIPSFHQSFIKTPFVEQLSQFAVNEKDKVVYMAHLVHAFLTRVSQVLHTREHEHE